MKVVLAIAQKDLRLLLRDKGDVFFTFVFPVILAVFFGFVFGGGGGAGAIEVALVVESDSQLAAGMARDLDADPSLEVTRFDSRDAALAAVRAGKATAAIVLPATMQDGVDGLFAGGGIPVEAVVDPSRRAEAGLIQGKLNELAFRQFPTLFADREQTARLLAGARRGFAESDALSPAQKLLASGMIAAGESFMQSMQQSAAAGEGGGTASGAWSPIAVTVAELPPRAGGPRSSFDISFPQGLVWGLAGCIAAFASSIVTERARGTLARLRLAPITPAHLMLGKGLACFVAAMMVQMLLIGLAVAVFGSRVAQPAMLGVACVASAFAFAGLAMLVAGFCRTEAEANGAGRGAILILAMVGGGTIPLFFMPPLLRTLSYGSPFRWVVAAIEGPFWRETPVSEQWPALVVLCAIGAMGFLAGVRGLGRPFGR